MPQNGQWEASISRKQMSQRIRDANCSDGRRVEVPVWTCNGRASMEVPSRKIHTGEFVASYIDLSHGEEEPTRIVVCRMVRQNNECREYANLVIILMLSPKS